MNKYIVINSEDIQKRIDELEKTDEFFSQGSFGEHKILKQILSNSKPLTPIIEDVLQYAGNFPDYEDISTNILLKYWDKYKQDYINNLKLDI